MAGAALRLKMAFSSTSPSITLGAKAPCAAAAGVPLPAPPVSPCKRGWWRSPAATAMPSPLAVEATTAAAEALVLATLLQL